MLFMGIICALMAVATLFVASASVTSKKDLTQTRKNCRTILIMMVVFMGLCRLSAYSRYSKDRDHYYKYGSHLYQTKYYRERIDSYNRAPMFSFYTSSEISFFRSTTPSY